MYANLSLKDKIPHITPIIPVYFVIIEVVFTMNYYVIFNNQTKGLIRLLSLIFFEPLAILTIITHLKSMFTNPGYVPIPFQQIITNQKDNHSRENYCKQCNNPRPLRSHHCKICRKCTLKMDHHCPWIANCVGYYNQKNFYQFLFCASFGDLFGFIFILIQFINTDKTIKNNVPNNVRITSPFTLIYYMWAPIQIVIGCLCALAVTIGVGTLFYKQTFMLLNNQTTIDKKQFEKWECSPYYEKNQMKSFCSVLGNNYIDWISLKFDGNDPCYLDRNKGYVTLENV